MINTESKLSAEIKRQFKKYMPRAVVLKHTDALRAGIPDVTITAYGSTQWWEYKMLKPHETRSTFREHINALQLATCRLLAREGRCWYFIAYPGNPANPRDLDPGVHASIWHPDALYLLRETPKFDYADISGGGAEYQGSLGAAIEKMLSMAGWF